MAAPSRPNFHQRFVAWQKQLQKFNRGCLFCSGGVCFRQFAEEEAVLWRWREEFAALGGDDSKSKQEAQDQLLRWMFWGQGEVETACSIGERVPTTPTSPSPKSDPAPPQPNSSSSDQPAPKRKCRRTSLAQVPQRADTSDEGSPRRDTTSESESSGVDVAEGLAAVAGPSSTIGARTARRQYAAGKARRATKKPSLCLMGKPVCFAAARALVGVGTHRLYRIKDCQADGRRLRASLPRGHSPNATATASVRRLLWRLYHEVAKGLPDRFTFTRQDAKTLTVGVQSRVPEAIQTMTSWRRRSDPYAQLLCMHRLQ